MRWSRRAPMLRARVRRSRESHRLRFRRLPRATADDLPLGEGRGDDAVGQLALSASAIALDGLAVFVAEEPPTVGLRTFAGRVDVVGLFRPLPGWAT